MNTAERRKAVEQELNCQNYLMIKVPTRKQVVSISADIVMLLSAIKLVPLLVPLVAIVPISSWLYIGVTTAALIAKGMVKS